MTVKKVNVLGVEYEVRLGTREELHIDKDTIGECQYYGKRIISICTEDPEDCRDEEVKEEIIKGTILHELSHAFLKESGLLEYAVDETLVEWLSVNIPRIMNTALQLEDEIGLI